MATDVMEWGVAALSRGGETVSGDQYLVVPIADGVLMAVVDGVGHGLEAALAAELNIQGIYDELKK